MVGGVCLTAITVVLCFGSFAFASSQPAFWQNNYFHIDPSLEKANVGADGQQAANSQPNPAFKASVDDLVHQSIQDPLTVDTPSDYLLSQRLQEIGETVQFQLPKHKEQMFRQKGLGDPPSPLISSLQYEYSYGSESDIEYRENADLDNSLKDDKLILTPELNGFFRYRPTNWIEATTEMIFDREIPIFEEDLVVLPDGDIAFAPDRRFSLLVDQLYFTLKQVIAPFKLSVGRKNFEDVRHYIYDTSIDIAQLEFKQGKFWTELWFGRENLVDLDAIKKIRPTETTPSCCIPSTVELKT